MAKELKFSVVLKEMSVSITGINGVEIGQSLYFLGI